MSEKRTTARAFHDAVGVEDWRVLYSGAHAYFPVASFAEAARERATLRLGGVFLKIDADQTRTDVSGPRPWQVQNTNFRQGLER